MAKKKPEVPQRKPYARKGGRSLFDPSSPAAYPVSRTGISLFVECPRCFYLEKRFGVARPPLPGFTLNNAVDSLLKREFDIYRAKGSAHPLMKEYGIAAVPYDHEQLGLWRDSLRGGIQFLHEPSNLIVRGGIDDVWVNPRDELHIVDYKATSKREEVNLDGFYQQGYKRQMEIYQWLFRKNGFTVSDMGYFVYCNGNSGKETFDAKLDFAMVILPYEGNDSWVEDTIIEIGECLRAENLPPANPSCLYCGYLDARNIIERRNPGDD